MSYSQFGMYPSSNGIYLPTSIQNNTAVTKNMLFNAPPKIEKSTSAKIGTTIAWGLGALTLFELGALALDSFGPFRGKGLFSKNLKNLARLRVDNNVVKRTNLTMDQALIDINKLVAKNGMKSGDCVNLTRASQLSIFDKLKLQENALVLSDKDGKLLKILDAQTLDQQILAGLGNNLNNTLRITV